MKMILSLALCVFLGLPDSLGVAASPVCSIAQSSKSVGKRRHVRKRARRKAATKPPSTATSLDLNQLIQSFSDADIRSELARRTLPAAPLSVLEEEAEKRKLLSFTDKEIRAELNRRLLTAFWLDKLQAEAERRGIQ